MKKIFSMIMLSMLLLILVACGDEKAKETEPKTPVQSEQTEQEDTTTAPAATYAEAVTENPIVTITMENDEQIVIELMPKVAPNTVANFIHLIEENYYDGLIFHRVIPGFMIQGGDPTGTGMGGPDYSIEGEFSTNGFNNELVHERGVISMARSSSPNSAGSQFFIMAENAPHLDGQYAAFGKVLEGLEVVDQIVNSERDQSDKPLKDQKMKSVTVDTKGFDYPNPVIFN